MTMNGCVACPQNLRAVDRLTEKNQRLRQRSRYGVQQYYPSLKRDPNWLSVANAMHTRRVLW
jgi:hypothetical protein